MKELLALKNIDWGLGGWVCVLICANIMMYDTLLLVSVLLCMVRYC